MSEKPSVLILGKALFLYFAYGKWRLSFVLPGFLGGLSTASRDLATFLVPANSEPLVSVCSLSFYSTASLT